MCYTLGQQLVVQLIQWSQAVVVLTLVIIMEAVDVLIVVVATVNYSDTRGYVMYCVV